MSFVVAAVGWDLLLGEPPRRLHPVVALGNAVSALMALAPGTGRWAQLGFGLLLALLLSTSAAAAGWLVGRLPVLLAVPLHIYCLKSRFALRSHLAAGARMDRALRAGDLPAARAQLGWLCSRDGSRLTSDELVAASIESLAENTSDSVVAPLFYYVLFGLPGALAYRAINTLDAMVGYHGRYEYLGKAAARLDDLANWLPARLTGVLLLLAAPICRKPLNRGWRMWMRDAGRTESPNAGIPMATMAGLLGLRLSKPGAYELGDPRLALHPDRIGSARGLVLAASLLALALVSLFLGLVPW